MRFLVGLMLAAPLAHAAEPASARREQTLVLSRLSDDPQRDIQGLRPLLDYVVARMGDVGIVEGRILMARNAAQMIGFLRHHRVDWVTETAATAAEFRHRTNAEVVLVADRGGQANYHSVLFTWRGSGIATVADLNGRSIAFQNPTSTSGFVLPTAHMLRAGLELEMLLSPFDKPDVQHVGYTFADTEANIVIWVQKRIVDAGAFSDLDWNALDHMPAGFRDGLVIIDQTAPAPRGLELVAAGLNPKIKARLVQVLRDAGDDPQAREALRSYFGVTHFTPLDAALRRELDRIQDDTELVRRELE